jgi:hypothetical protein
LVQIWVSRRHDVEFEVTRTPTLSGWNRFLYRSLRLTKAHIAQLVLSGAAGTVYIDNVYFSKVVETSLASFETAKSYDVSKSSFECFNDRPIVL